MSRLRKFIPLLMIAALALVALPVSAAILPTPALYMCTVYEDGALVGAGKTVEAFVGAETVARASAETDASGVAILELSVDEVELGGAVSFKVDGILAAETPDVDVSIAGLDVRLDYTSGVVTYYTLTVNITPTAGGTVTLDPTQPAGGYEDGTSVELTANAASGYDFDHWSGAASGTSTTTHVTMTADKTVTAHFEEEGAPPTGEGFAYELYETFIECLRD